MSEKNECESCDLAHLLDRWNLRDPRAADEPAEVATIFVSVWCVWSKSVAGGRG